MRVIERDGLFYLGHSFKKKGKTVYRARYLGKTLPTDLEDRKQILLRECLQEDVFIKIQRIKRNYQKEWKKLPESVKKKVLTELAIQFTYNTNAIEGSTITLHETEELVKRALAPNKSLPDIQETVQHINVFSKALHASKITKSTMLTWHKELFSLTKKDIAGKIRDYHVRVNEYRAPDWQDVLKLLKQFFEWYAKNEKNLNPVEFAARAHYKFEKIHPFGDGNGRIGRLIIAHILKKNSFPVLVIEYKKRKSYYHALAKDENKFLQYFLRRYLGYFKEYI